MRGTLIVDVRRLPPIAPFWILVLVCSLGVVRASTINDNSVRCCQVGEELAQSSGDCKGAHAYHMHMLPTDTSKKCLGYLSRCCRRKAAEDNCLKGREHARAGKPCEELSSTRAEECCAACQDGLSSRTCSAPWFEEEPMLSFAYQTCCEQPTTPSAQLQVIDRLTYPSFPGVAVALGSQGPQVPRAPTRYLQTPRTRALRGPITCSEGYHYNRTLLICEDIDECFLGKYSCPRGTICLNLPGTYECSYNVFELQKSEVIPDCPTGFFYSRHVQDCIDRDECASGEPICSPDEVCMNTIGNYRCRSKSWTDCEPGYGFQNDQGCLDMNQCSDLHDCSSNEECVDRGGQYICVDRCQRGFTVDPVVVECSDVDECIQGTDNCTAIETCINVEGSFRCEAKQLPACDHGYHRQNSVICEDIDECTMGIHNCTAMDDCINTEGDFECRAKPPCREGYRRNKNGDCKDIDECKEYPGVCRPYARCVNMAGSFVCQRSCGQGYNHDNGTCTDIDECATGDMTCLPGQRCQNLEGSALCVDEDCELLGKVTAPDGTCLLPRTCPEGYYHDPEFDMCRDINECAQQYPKCATDERCTNTLGSYFCTRIINPNIVITCPEGQRRSTNGTTCEDVDECQEDLHTCDPNTETCENVFGSFNCHCKGLSVRDWRGKCVSTEQNRILSDEASKCVPGYRAKGEQCVDTDECFEAALTNSPICDHDCVNLPGGYRCACRGGFELDPFDPTKCVDVDECQRGFCKGSCTNEIGSFKCTCPAGFVMSAHATCVDVDECRAGTHNCTGSAKCINIQGDFRCVDFTCPKGSAYRKDTKRSRCIRTEPCEEHSCRFTPSMITFAYKPLKRDLSQQEHMKISIKPSHERGRFGEFTFNVDKVIDHRRTLKGKLATNEDFKLESHKRWAKLLLRRRLTEAQDIHLTLKAKIYRLVGWPRKDELQETLEWKIVLYVPQNTF